MGNNSLSCCSQEKEVVVSTDGDLGKKKTKLLPAIAEEQPLPGPKTRPEMTVTNPFEKKISMVSQVTKNTDTNSSLQKHSFDEHTEFFLSLSKVDFNFFSFNRIQKILLKEVPIYDFSKSGYELYGTDEDPIKQFENADLRYFGQWKKERKSGRGHMQLPNGDFYVCTFLNDSPNGYGAVYYANGDYFFGRFRNGQLDEGELTKDFTEEVYTGTFKNNLFHGKGTYVYSDGMKYEGEFENGVRSGAGQFWWPNGMTYVGRWKNNVQDGPGVLTTEKGFSESVIYQDGRKI